MPGCAVLPSSAPSAISSASLRTLALPLVIMQKVNTQALASLLPACKNSLRYLDLGVVANVPATVSELPMSAMQPVVDVAPQLLSLSVAAVCPSGRYEWGTGTFSRTFSPSVVQSDYLTATLSALRDIHTLTLGTCGYSHEELFPTLQALPYLATLTIRDHQKYHYDGHLRRFKSAATIDFLLTAPALQYLTLPHQLSAVWTSDEIKNVEATAEQCGVWFDLE